MKLSKSVKKTEIPVKKITVVKKKITQFRPRIRSRHPSHSVLRTSLPLMPFKSVIRLGSTTDVDDIAVEINSIEAIKNSSSKLRMKNCFTEADVKTADWVDNIQDVADLEYPIVSKGIFGSRGTANELHQNEASLKSWAEGKDLKNYIFEKFYNYNREYRLHVTSTGCFYTCRKMLKTDTPEDSRWFRNDSNSVWIIEENELFDRPVNWDEIVKHCIKALESCGLDFGACDVRVQSSKDKEGKKRKVSDFIIVEINSAPSFGAQTETKYLEILPELLQTKYKKLLEN